MSFANYLKIKGLSPQLLVSDLRKSISFYTEKLGFEVLFQYEDFYCGIAKDGFSIHLKLAEPFNDERIYRKNHRHVDLLFSVYDIEEHYQETLKNALMIIEPLRIMPYGKEFYIADPDDYILAFVEEN